MLHPPTIAAAVPEGEILSEWLRIDDIAEFRAASRILEAEMSEESGVDRGERTANRRQRYGVGPPIIMPASNG